MNILHGVATRAASRTLFLCVALTDCGRARVAEAEDPLPVLLATDKEFEDAYRERDTPQQEINPERFWKGKTVYQKTGIVIESKDFMTRFTFWVLPVNAHGEVSEVVRKGKSAYARVAFADQAMWLKTSIRPPEQRSATFKQGVRRSAAAGLSLNNPKVIPDSEYGGTLVDRDGVEVVIVEDLDPLLRKHVLGSKEQFLVGTAADVIRLQVQDSDLFRVDPERCGVIIDDRNGIIVEFPISLIGIPTPLIGQTVVRAEDWSDGFSDGGMAGIGSHAADAEKYIGRVVESRNRDGFVTVVWDRTNRRCAHRFDKDGFYDVQLLKE